ncbi:MAG TPA: hypothetical protein VF151_10990 [Gemmatimonadales bacterium]
MRRILELDAEGRTLQEMGDELGFTRQRAQQVLLEAKSWRQAGQL